VLPPANAMAVSGGFACRGPQHSNCKKVEMCLKTSARSVPISDSGMELDWMGVTCCDHSGFGYRPLCKKYATYAEAQAHCSDWSMRLCTSEEIRKGAGEGNSCMFDQSLVWTSTPCNLAGEEKDDQARPREESDPGVAEPPFLGIPPPLLITVVSVIGCCCLFAVCAFVLKQSREDRLDDEPLQYQPASFR